VHSTFHQTNDCSDQPFLATLTMPGECVRLTADSTIIPTCSGTAVNAVICNATCGNCGTPMPAPACAPDPEGRGYVATGCTDMRPSYSHVFTREVFASADCSGDAASVQYWFGGECQQIAANQHMLLTCSGEQLEAAICSDGMCMQNCTNTTANMQCTPVPQGQGSTMASCAPEVTTTGQMATTAATTAATTGMPPPGTTTSDGVSTAFFGSTLFLLALIFVTMLA
jgi:hypothetical protein